MGFSVSVGIMAYNEEAMIGSLLKAIIQQRYCYSRLHEVIVVASGCTDNTEDVVRRYMQKDHRIKLLIQPQREGKASAINLFLDKASGEILILESADTVPGEDALKKLIAPFLDPKVGMTGARPIPVNSKDTFIGFTVHLMWTLHHKIALSAAKLGELVAFRNIVGKIPKYTAVDEAYIEAIIKDKGYDLRYVPDALVKNKGPDNASDFIKQRRRIAVGHKYLYLDQKYSVSTHSPLKILKVLIPEIPGTPKGIAWTVGAVILEAIGRLLGLYDYVLRRENPYIWDIARSTKRW
jgi:cellulose synthase/poly-beta-1,6-N-acetylglucosamine synthase-like glycosyltransferase